MDREHGGACRAGRRDLLLAVTVTSLLRHRMSHKPWRAVHVMAYAAWGMGLVHGMKMGTDAATVWGSALNFGCIAAVSVSVLARFGLLAHSRLVTT